MNADTTLEEWERQRKEKVRRAEVVGGVFGRGFDGLLCPPAGWIPSVVNGDTTLEESERQRKNKETSCIESASVPFHLLVSVNLKGQHVK